MKIPAWLFIFILSTGFLSFPSRLDRAFEALEIYNYFDAKELFYKSLKRDSVPAAYGLSVIFGRDDNPFTNIDSAHKYIGIAERNFPDLEVKKREDYLKYGVDSAAIKNQALHVDSLAFERAEQKNTTEAWNDFISRFDHTDLVRQAILNRNELAFEETESIGSSEAYAKFLSTYPQSLQAGKAKKKYEEKLYEERTEPGNPFTYQKFAANFPESPYKMEALNEVYLLETKNGTLDEYVDFVKSYPDNPNVEKAWRRIYALEVKEVTPKSIAKFTLQYPEYPFMNELRSDFDLATTRYYPVEENGKWGFINEDGQLAIIPEYNWVENFSDGMAMVGMEEGVTFIDKSGHRISDAAYDDAYPFASGYAVVEINGNLGIINRLGEWVADPEYGDLGEFSEGKFYAEKNGRYGYLDEDGEVALPFLFDDANDFQTGVAVVDSSGLRGLIDSTGMLIAHFDYDWIEGFVDHETPSRFRINDRFGLMLNSGEIVTDTLYEMMSPFSEGFILAAMNEKYGFMNASGDTAIAFTYDFSDRALEESYFQNGYAKVFQKDKVGVIDTTGKKVFPAIFEDVGTFMGQLIPIKKRGEWGYADLKVDLAIPYQFDYADNFRDSVAIVSKNGRFGLIDTLGKPRIALNYTSMAWVDTLLLASDSAYGLLNISGDTLVPLQFEEAVVVDDHIIRFQTKSGEIHYYDYRRQEFLRREEN